MKRTLRSALLALLILAAGACARHTIIPDDELALIFRDAFLSNAYLNDRNLSTDSLNIYEPIFARYGYTTADVQYTIGNFSKRKSARLGDVVEQAIQMLETEGTYLDHEVAALDTIDNAARRAFTRPIFSDTLIRVRTLRDTSRLRLSFKVAPGEYKVSLKYLIDSLDRNEGALRGAVWLERDDSTRSGYYAFTMRRNNEEEFSRSFPTDSTHRRLRVEVGSFRDKPRQPSIIVRNLTVSYIPPVAAAVDSLYERQLNVRIFADDFFGAFAKDSL